MVYYTSNQEGDIALTKSKWAARHAAKQAHKRGLNLITVECYDGEYHGSGGSIRYIEDFVDGRFIKRNDLTCL